VPLGHLADDGKPETGAGDAAGRRRAVEAVEDMGQIGGRDARAEIAHGELAGPQAHLDPGAGRAELSRVIQQVPDGDLQAVGAAGSSGTARAPGTPSAWPRGTATRPG